MTVESPWVPRATCDAGCVAAGAAPSGRPVAVAMRVAVRATLAVILLSAVPLLAIPMPGRSHIQRGYCRMMLRALGVRITVSGGPIRNLRGVLVVSGHVSWVDIFSIGAVIPLLPYLLGASIDFEDTIQKQGFTIDNPNASGSCACGDSFH